MPVVSIRSILAAALLAPRVPSWTFPTSPRLLRLPTHRTSAELLGNPAILLYASLRNASAALGLCQDEREWKHSSKHKCHFH